MKKANAIVKELRDTLDEIIFLEEMGLFPKSQRMLKRLEKEVIEYDLKSL